MALGSWYLNGTKLCPYGFSWSEEHVPIGSAERLVSGLLRRDIIAHKLTVKMSWDTLPESFDGTYHGYADLRTLGTSPSTAVLIRPTGTTTGTTQYTVVMSPPSGEVAVRLEGNNVWWDVSMTVEEQ